MRMRITITIYIHTATGKKKTKNKIIYSYSTIITIQRAKLFIIGNNIHLQLCVDAVTPGDKTPREHVALAGPLRVCTAELHEKVTTPPCGTMPVGFVITPPSDGGLIRHDSGD